MDQHATLPENRNRRILIVEDEPMLAFALEETLLDAGFEIAGVAGDLAAALAIIASGVCDAAILDVNLSGTSAGPAALALAGRGLPFLILSGYASNQLPAAFDGAPRLQKPCRTDRLIQTLHGLLLVRQITRGR
jgi:DNA-binding NtrC family response regulator